MSPLWLLPAAVMVVAAPVIVPALRAVLRETEALLRGMDLLRDQLRPAMIRLRNESEQLGDHRLHRTS